MFINPLLDPTENMSLFPQNAPTLPNWILVLVVGQFPIHLPLFISIILAEFCFHFDRANDMVWSLLHEKCVMVVVKLETYLCNGNGFSNYLLF